jgi:hypothetical protein
MKIKIDPSTTAEQKMERFRAALRSVLEVSHDDLKKTLVEEEKQRRLRKDKPGPRTDRS